MLYFKMNIFQGETSLRQTRQNEDRVDHKTENPEKNDVIRNFFVVHTFLGVFNLQMSKDVKEYKAQRPFIVLSHKASQEPSEK